MLKKIISIVLVSSLFNQVALSARRSFQRPARRVLVPQVTQSQAIERRLTEVTVLAQDLLHVRNVVLEGISGNQVVNSRDAERLHDLIQNYLERFESLQNLEAITPGYNLSHEAGILKDELNAYMDKMTADMEDAIRGQMTGFTGAELWLLGAAVATLAATAYQAYNDYSNHEETMEKKEEELEDATERADFAESIEDKVCEDDEEEDKNNITAETDIGMMIFQGILKCR